MPAERCPMCLKISQFDLEHEFYYRFQNSERLVCKECIMEVEHKLRPTWQIVGKRVFPKKVSTI